MILYGNSKNKHNILYVVLWVDLHLAAEGDTADRLPVVPVAITIRGVNSERIKAEAIGVGAKANGGPVVAVAACFV